MSFLSKTYLHLNEHINRVFFSHEHKGDFVAVFIDDDLINLVATELGLTVDRFWEGIARDLAFDWSLTLNRRLVDKPQYMGLIAVQMYAAHLMDDDDLYGETAYNPRLCNLLGIDEFQLQQLYKENQDQLWKEFGIWCQANGFEIEVPAPRSGPGRFTQYPLSYALLNRKDLKRLPYVFDYVGLRSGENLFFEDFTALLRHADKHPRVTSHYLKVKDRVHRDEREDAFYRQIFEYYHSWDGCLPETEETDEEEYMSRSYQGGDFFLTIDVPFTEIIVRNKQNDVIETYSLQDHLALEKINNKYRVLQNKMLFFIASSDYEDSWENQRFLERNSNCLIIAPKKKQVLSLITSVSSGLQIEANDHFDIVNFYLTDHTVLDESFQAAFFRRSPVRLKGGLKLGRMQWMYGAGPLLYFLQTGEYYLNGVKITVQQNSIYPCTDFPLGRYALKHKDHSPIVFHVEDFTEQESIPLPETGWLINSDSGDWAPDQNDFSISGVFFLPPPVNQNPTEPIRDWIIANTVSKNEEYTTLVINTLNRAKYGIPRRP